MPLPKVRAKYFDYFFMWSDGYERNVIKYSILFFCKSVINVVLKQSPVFMENFIGMIVTAVLTPCCFTL